MASYIITPSRSDSAVTIAQGGNSTLKLPGCVNIKVMDTGDGHGSVLGSKVNGVEWTYFHSK